MLLPGSLLHSFTPRKRPQSPYRFSAEPWYCCARPTREQFVSLGQVSKSPQEAVPATGN